MNFAIVILSYNQPETTIDCIKSVQAVKPREFSDKQIFIVHNGSDESVVQDLRKRFPRFYHVVLADNEGFAAGANAGLAAAFALHPWVLFLTQDTTLLHFPKSPPFEPCMATVKIFKRTQEAINSMGGAVDLELAKSYLCPKPELFWKSFESEILSPYIPRTAFWMHQTPFEKLGGFEESIGTMWEDIDFSLRLRREGEMLQLDDTTEVIHHRKGICRREPLYTQYYYNRNRFYVSRLAPRPPAGQIKFEVGLVIEWLLLLLGAIGRPHLKMIFFAYLDSRKKILPMRYHEGMAVPLAMGAANQADSGFVTAENMVDEAPRSSGSPSAEPPTTPSTSVPKMKAKKEGPVVTNLAAKPAAVVQSPEAKTTTLPTATKTEADTRNTTSTPGFRTTVAPARGTPVRESAAPIKQAAGAEPTRPASGEPQTESKFTPDDED